VTDEEVAEVVEPVVLVGVSGERVLERGKQESVRGGEGKEGGHVRREGGGDGGGVTRCINSFWHRLLPCGSSMYTFFLRGLVHMREEHAAEFRERLEAVVTYWWTPHHPLLFFFPLSTLALSRPFTTAYTGKWGEGVFDRL
jgi:hypothetical protein